MTEARATYQAGLWGGEQVAGDVVERLRILLANDRDARNDYDVCAIHYLQEFEGLDRISARHMIAATRKVALKTILNRCLDVQRMYPELDADPEVRAARNRKAKGGPVR